MLAGALWAVDRGDNGVIPADIDAAAGAPVRLRQRGAWALRARGHEDEVDMIVHQAPGEATRALRGAGGGEEREIFDAVVVAEEHWQTAIATLGDVVGDVGDDDAGESGHGGSVMGRGAGVNSV